MSNAARSRALLSGRDEAPVVEAEPRALLRAGDRGAPGEAAELAGVGGGRRADADPVVVAHHTGLGRLGAGGDHEDPHDRQQGGGEN